MTAKGVPQRVLGSASYQVGKMDVLNVRDSTAVCIPGSVIQQFLRVLLLIHWQGTPALFLILLLCNHNMIGAYVEDERFVVQWPVMRFLLTHFIIAQWRE